MYPEETEVISTESIYNHRYIQDISRKQVTACCLLFSILNYICCPILGIPALIFAILGLEAEKRQEIEAAKSHAFHLKIFNIICFSLLILISIPVVLMVVAIAVLSFLNLQEGKHFIY